MASKKKVLMQVLTILAVHSGSILEKMAKNNSGRGINPDGCKSNPPLNSFKWKAPIRTARCLDIIPNKGYSVTYSINLRV